ncbi:hypothetical protein C2E31_18555 [Rhodopirellula baltica]|nr:hypothetical protein C2E31_18555 [Rhodopirellula baltica]
MKRLTAIGVAHLLIVIALITPSCAQSTPTFKDVAYDDVHPAQRLDVYQAQSDQPTPAMVFFHGGGWSGGSKEHVPGWLLRLAAENKASVVAVEYRFTYVATHPAQVNDCLRAIQFIRQNAKKWNIASDKIGVTGGSAGGHLSAYVALADDAADPDSTDPVETQSSRVACAVSFAGPTDWSLLKSIDHQHPAYRQLIGYQPGTPAGEMDAAKMTDVSPISFVSKDDPPMMQVHGDADDIVPIEHAYNLDKALKSVGVECELVTIPNANHSVANAGDNVAKQATRFVEDHLLGQSE